MQSLEQFSRLRLGYGIDHILSFSLAPATAPKQYYGLTIVQNVATVLTAAPSNGPRQFVERESSHSGEKW